MQLSQDYSSTHTTAGSYNKKHGTITITVPFKDVPGVTHKHPTLYSATAFTGSTTAPLTVPNPTGAQGQINQLDATPPFDYVVSKHAVTAKAAAAPPNGSGSASDWVVGVLAGVGGVALLSVAGVIGVRRRRDATRKQLVLR